MSRSEYDRGGNSIAVGAKPVGGGHTPSIARYQTRETALGHRGRQIITDVTLVLQELSGYHGAHRVAPQIPGSGVT